MIKVRASRLRCLSITITGSVLSTGLVLLDPGGAGSVADDLSRGSGILLLNLVIWCLTLLLRRWYFTYDPGRRTVTASGRWRSKGVYPWRGFVRLEYSVYNAKVYEVAASGKQRRLPVSRWFADPRDWKAFVDLLLADQPAPRAATDHPGTPISR